MANGYKLLRDEPAVLHFDEETARKEARVWNEDGITVLDWVKRMGRKKTCTFVALDEHGNVLSMVSGSSPAECWQVIRQAVSARRGDIKLPNTYPV